MPEWRWDGSTYRDEAGHEVAPERVYELVLESIRRSEDAVAELARLLTEGKLSLADWRRLMRETIKDEYVAFFLLGFGGLLLEEDVRQLVQLLAEQYAYLDQFVVQMGEGLPSNAQIIARSRSYIRSAGSAFWVATYDAVTRGGMTEVKWTMNPAEHCEDCIRFAGMGWQPIEDNPYNGAVPRSGDTQCLFNCLCVLEFG